MITEARSQNPIITEPDRALLAPLAAHAPLRQKLARAHIVASRAVPPDVVTLGSQVAYRDEDANMRRRVTVVLPQDANAAADRISVLSLPGAALLGLSAGQTAQCLYPDGTRHRLRVEYVLHQPERSLGLAIGA